MRHVLDQVVEWFDQLPCQCPGCRRVRREERLGIPQARLSVNHIAAALAAQGGSASVGYNPWRPMARPVDVKHLGKLIEELAEAGSAAARCLIQGIDEAEPVTGKINRAWLEDELADVRANDQLVVAHFGLDEARIAARAADKARRLKAWHYELVGEGSE